MVLYVLYLMLVGSFRFTFFFSWAVVITLHMLISLVQRAPVPLCSD